MYEEFINNIREGCKIRINGVLYDVLSKTHYSSKENPDGNHVKCKLSNNKVLVIIPDELIYIGEIDNNLPVNFIDDNSILVNNKKFIKTATGCQIVRYVDFGKDEDVERECEFIDYESEDGKRVISFGILVENNEQADVNAEIINISDIKIEN
jgi:hypothetical protein